MVKIKFHSGYIYWLVLLAFSLSALFFTINIVDLKEELGKNQAGDAIPTGKSGIVTKILDGDEIIITQGKNSFRIRILGIKSFDPSVNDILIQNIARQAYQFLQKSILGKNIELEFDTPLFDKNKRILAYVNYQNQDIGKRMIASGLSLVYIRYPFSRMHAYAEAEHLARIRKRGLWNIPRLVKRSLSLKVIWEMEKEKKEEQ